MTQVKISKEHAELSKAVARHFKAHAGREWKTSIQSNGNVELRLTGMSWSMDKAWVFRDARRLFPQFAEMRNYGSQRIIQIWNHEEIELNNF